MNTQFAFFHGKHDECFFGTANSSIHMVNSSKKKNLSTTILLKRIALVLESGVSYQDFMILF